jgi:hypothetical protein
LALVNNYIKEGKDTEILGNIFQLFFEFMVIQGDAEKFFSVVQMPYLKQRLESLLYKVTFDQRVKDLQSKLSSVQHGIAQVNASTNLVKLLEVTIFGNDLIF